MRILYIANRAEIFGGGQISFFGLTSRIDKSRFEPVVLCPGEGELSEKFKKIGIETLTWQMSTAKNFQFGRTSAKAMELRSIIKKRGIDIVHPNGSRAQFYASLAVKGMKTSLIWHARESKRDFFPYDWFLARSADRIICVSDAVRKKRFSFYPWIDRKILVVYNGVDTHYFIKDELARKNIREELGIRKDEALVGILSNLIRRKGHKVLIRAFKHVKRKCPNARLLIVGKTVEENYMRELRKLASESKVLDKVIFMGHRHDVNSILSALDVFVLPSKEEGFSRALLEAMSCSTPIVTTDVEGNNEAIVEGESGLIVHYGDSISLANAITFLLRNKETAHLMGLRARERAVKEFRIEDHVSKIEQIYEELKG